MPAPAGGDGHPLPGRSAVAIGGGHGLARTLRALTGVVEHVTAVVTVADDGGSSGRLRRDLAVLPPGDLRMALTALAPHSELAELVGYRFGRGELAGHSLGNLLLVALQDRCDGDVVRALDRLVALLDVRGRVLPCTTQAVGLHAATDSGHVNGQASIAATPGLRRVWLEPADPPATPEAVEAIGAADLVVLGPGSLYTSLLPNLLVPDVAAALAASTAPRVLVGNLRPQSGETEGMTLADHLRTLTEHVPALRIDAVLAADPAATTVGGLELGGQPLPASGRLLLRDLAGSDGSHDPASLRRALAELV